MTIAGLLLAIFLSPDSSIIIDRIVAVVDNQVITLSDMEKAISLFPNFRNSTDTDEQFYRRVIEDLIDYRVISAEFRSQFNLTEDDFESLQTAILQKAGSMEQLRATLDRFQLDWNGFRAFISERVFYEKVIHQKFAMNILIPFSEIDKFYQTDYLLVQRQYELQPASLVVMAPLIEQHLRRMKTDERLVEWLADIRATHQVEIHFEGDSHDR